MDITHTSLQHQHVISDLCEELHRPQQEVAQVFAEEFDKLDRQAKIKTFLPLITCRIVRERLATPEARSYQGDAPVADTKLVQNHRGSEGLAVNGRVSCSHRADYSQPDTPRADALPEPSRTRAASAR